MTDIKKQKELEKLKKEKDEYLKGWQRERADFINYKKTEKERFKEVVRFSNERIVKSLIAILDGFDLAIESFLKEGKDKKENDNYLKGIYLIKSQLQDILEKEGVDEIKVKIGEKLNPAFHEVVAMAEDEKFDPDTIIKILEKGYILNDKVIRPCRVILAKENK
ncbi:MAG TPA: nucleotide exchange factor GrpE [Candidatus Paceibacterota bacterium]|nr:nucleotide exchange factor GrpE [Candidatus Paceibacterota bacterium]